MGAGGDERQPKPHLAEKIEKPTANRTVSEGDGNDCASERQNAAERFGNGHQYYATKGTAPLRSRLTIMVLLGARLLVKMERPSRFAVTRVTLRRGESSGAEPHTKGMVAHV